ncbi:MAG: DUF3097 domain-containing protein [Propionibacteriaceae bacterium]|nr:DUF3097 domain-containing protein [Propionibacteriaceae bacterium]
MTRYSSDVLAPGWRKAGKPVTTPQTLEVGLVVEDPTSGFVGAVTRWENGLVVLEDRLGKLKSFPIGPGFWVDGKPVELKVPGRASATPTHTRSGSRIAPTTAPKTAHESRIWVEGIHDAELIEKVWGDDLRYLGIVVEPLGGIDHLAERVEQHAPHDTRLLGILVDHLIQGTKETRIVTGVMKGQYADAVLITGHRYVDIWQAVRPSSLGLQAWPEVPRGTDWKQGICAGLGWPHRTPEDLARAWRKILAHVKSWEDLDRPFVTEVERLIDFVQPDDLD